MNPRNARFWYYHNGSWCKLTVRPGTSIRFGHGATHDEGYAAEETTIQHKGHHLRLSWVEWGRDCDGRYERTGEAFCLVGDDLAAVEIDAEFWPEMADQGHRTPAWEPGKVFEANEFARAMGY